MKRRRYWIILPLAVGVFFLSMTACSEKKTEESTVEESEKRTEKGEKETTEAEAEGAEELDYENMTAEDLLKDLLDKTELSDENFVWLTSTYRYVPITEELQLEENITSEAFSLLREKEIRYTCSEDSMKQLLASEYPQVRAEAYEWMESLLGLTDTNRALAKEAIGTEKDPYVLRAMIRTLGNEGSDPEIGPFLISMSKHTHPRVREQVAVWIGSSWNKEMEGAVEAEIALIQDEDQEVAKAACRNCGGLEDDRVVAPLAEILNDETKYELHGAAVDGLTDMWLDFPFHEATSEAAYKACMDYYKKTPRSENVPFWTTVGEADMISESSFPEWKEKASYYKPEELIAVMKEIALDPNADWLGRTAAFDVIKTHGGREALEAIKPEVDALTDKDASLVQDSLEDELKD